LVPTKFFALTGKGLGYVIMIIMLYHCPLKGNHGLGSLPAFELGSGSARVMTLSEPLIYVDQGDFADFSGCD